ncbi:MAG: beta-ketoacyl-[acyl-carrier-protein] synthase family protein [Nitrospirales bacterium]|nr:beta-ketoacyl-[acyl-carrier-protein] synthase family protein [Nitrospirales bacterium]
MEHRAVITGCGVCSPLGSGRESFFDALQAGVSGIDEITLFDASSFPVRIGGEVRDLSPDPVRERFPASADVSDRKVLLGLAAVAQAIEDAGLSDGALAGGDAGVSFGAALEVLNLEDLSLSFRSTGRGLAPLFSEILREGRRLQHPMDTTNRIVTARFRISGQSFLNCSACVASTMAIGQAFGMIRRGEAELFICGGFDSMINPLGVGGFSLLGALSSRNDLRGAACRPFDARRDGAVLGEGAGIVILESLDHALRRGARIYAEVVGFGTSLDAYKPTDPDPEGEGAALAMMAALSSAGLIPEEIDYINAHGTSTPKNDEVEVKAIKRVFGARAYRIPVSSTKSMHGHLIAASGAVETIACLLGFERNMIPPTINYKNPDPFCDLDVVPGRARAWRGRHILKNSFGFGGQNASLILKRWMP